MTHEGGEIVDSAGEGLPTTEDRRSGHVYYVLTEAQLLELAAKSGQAGGTAAVNDLLSLFSRKTAKNTGVLVALLMAALTTWLSGAAEQMVMHIRWIP